jgi:hypothetical protein
VEIRYRSLNLKHSFVQVQDDWEVMLEHYLLLTHMILLSGHCFPLKILLVTGPQTHQLEQKPSIFGVEPPSFVTETSPD